MDLFERLVQWFNNHPIFSGAALSFILALLRSVRTGGNWVATLFEASICSFLTIGAFSIVQAFFPSVTEQACVGIGSIIGYLGTSTVQKYLLLAINAKTNNRKDDDNE